MAKSRKRKRRRRPSAKETIAKLTARVLELEGVLAQHGKLGPPPVGNVLAAKAWVYGFLLEELEVTRTDPQLSKQQRRTEVLKIVDRINKLDDKAATQAALEKLLGSNRQLAQRRPGPPMTDAAPVDTPAGPVTPRRGRPPRSSLR